MNKIFSIVLILLLALGCGYAPTEEIYNPDYTPEISVFSIISTDDSDEFVIVEKTVRIDEGDEDESNTIIDDAEVLIISDTDTVQFTFYKDPQSNDWDSEYLSKGIYLDLNDDFLAKSGKTYRLVVKVPDGRTVTGSTTVPDIPVISQPGNWTVLPKETIENTSIHWEDNPNTIGYSIDFLVEISDSHEKIDLLPDSYVNESPATLSELDEFLLLSNVVPLLDIATIKVTALDQNSYDYFLKSNLASYIGTDLNILQGGVGLFGSFAVDYVMVRWE